MKTGKRSCAEYEEVMVEALPEDRGCRAYCQVFSDFFPICPQLSVSKCVIHCYYAKGAAKP
jgi:hypothetical protein